MKMWFDKSLEYRVLPIPFYTLFLCGVWCPNYLKFSFKRIYFFFTFSVISLQIILSIQIFLHVLILMWRREFDANVFFILLTVAIGAYKAINIFLYRERIMNLLRKAFEDYWKVPLNDSERNLLKNHSILCRRIQVFYFFVLVFGGFVKIMGPMMKINSDTQLPSDAWFPYDINKPLYFWLSYTHQIFCGSTSVLMHIGADTLMSGFFIQLCMQLKMLKLRFRNLSQHIKHIEDHKYKRPPGPKLETKLIKQYISAHIFLFSFSKKMNLHFFGILSTLVIVTMPNICMNVYVISVSEFKMNIDSVTSLGLFSIVLFQIYIPCWFGNEVMIHSLEIGDAIYEMDWINMTPDLKKILFTIMIRSTKPIEIQAIYIFRMCLRTYLYILKTSYSVANLLQRNK